MDTATEKEQGTVIPRPQSPSSRHRGSKEMLMTAWDQSLCNTGEPGHVVPRVDGSTLPALDPEEADTAMEVSPCQHLL